MKTIDFLMALIGTVFLMAVGILAIVGWFLNLTYLFSGFDSDLNVEMVLRIIGVVVPPLGAILGWF